MHIELNVFKKTGAKKLGKINAKRYGLKTQKRIYCYFNVSFPPVSLSVQIYLCLSVWYHNYFQAGVKR